MHPRRKSPATDVARSVTSHATAPTQALPVLAGESAGTPAEVDIPEVAGARSATSAARLGISPAIAMREEAAADMEGVMDKAKGDTEAEVVTIVVAAVRVRLATPVEAMVICLATAPKAKNVITVSSSCILRKVKQ